MSDVLLIHPGRFGDIILCLPIALHYHLAGLSVSWVVEKNFASILEGCSYVEPLLWSGEYMDGTGALKAFQGHSRRSINLRINGSVPAWQKYPSFAHAMWAQTELLDRFDSLPLVFDQRDKQRELKLIQSVLGEGGLKTGEKLLIVSLDGHSSPFKAREDALAMIRSIWTTGRIVVIGANAVMAERLFDLCGLLELASLMISTDSAPMHLSFATSTPLIGLQSDVNNSWHASPRRAHWVEAIPYKDALVKLPKLLTTYNKN